MKIMLTITLLLISITCFAPVTRYRPEFRIEVDPLERLFLAVAMVESGGDSLAIGTRYDRGIVQITPVLQLDYLQRTGRIIDPFRTKDSKEVFMYYAALNGPEPEKIARIWHRGSEWQDKKGKRYWQKISEQLNK